MEPFTDAQQIAAYWGRTLDAGQQAQANDLAAAASGIIRDEFPTIDERIALGQIAATTVSYIASQMVIRVLRNPEAIKQESVGGESVTLADGAVSPDLWLMPGERARLRRRRTRVGSMRLRAGLGF